MNKACALCKGACCESIVLDLTRSLTRDQLLWFSLHGTVEMGGVRLEAPCKMLKSGECSVWSSRPNVCRDYKVGGKHCVEAIQKRRSEQADEIIALAREVARTELT